MKKTLAFISIVAWFTLGIYAGASGLIYEEGKRQKNAKEQSEPGQQYEYDGIVFSSKETLEQYIDDIQIDQYFPWLSSTPELLILILTSCSLGAFGGLIRIIRPLAFGEAKLEDTKFLSIPFLGLLLGMLVLGISYLFPAVLITENEVEIRQTSLMFFSLFAGLFSESFLNWLENKFKTYLKNKN